MTAPEMSQEGETAPDLATIVAAAVDAVQGDRTRLMDVAQEVQRRFGYVSDEAVRAIAARLDVHGVEVEDAVSFYTFLNREPKGRFHLRLSRTPVSMMKGAAAVAEAFSQATGAPIGGTSPDGLFTLEWTNDIGMADQEPAALVGGAVLTALAPEDAVPIVAALRGHRGTGSMPLFSGPDVRNAGLPKAGVATGLVKSGPVVFQPSQAAGSSAGLAAALAASPEDVIRAVTQSKLRGRGGAGFPTGLKWKLCRQSAATARRVVCNADEGEPGTFKDRVLLTEIPDAVFEGMTIAGYALGARQGIVYLRGEYAYLWDRLQAVLDERRHCGLLGEKAGGREGFAFDIRIQLGAGAYICGEESALIDSLEGKRGAPRDRPPFPTDRGYLQQPTAVDNVETFVCAARIMEKGPDWFAGFGTRESTGTKLLSVSGDCERPGVYEVAFGITVNALLDLVGAPDAAFVQMGGPSGQCVAPKDFGRSIAYEDLSTGGSVMVFNAGRDVLDVAAQFAEFFVEESCGWCTPCRVGTTLLRKGMEKILANRATLADVAALETLATTVSRTSRCGLGQSAPNPILSTMRNFPDAYEARLQPAPFLPAVTLQEALAVAVAVQGREPVGEGETA
ncbi:MAG TPA: NADH-ubiquinone oxidoreductase-F iron-sulfur binding region domain-containing protein [Rhodopila sp.]|uniref:NADH-ubiquinone oxidoreductase-F iron-sulfur binding region domain-containing protein n=1 Tax=Rhodopila sp. TaxID=2480087 RepID=UPI002C02BFFA|nr:NADH-ubiquinone oxidoreductase-F iron-sulfur binding region domain-containing protein [Rhodopila sp.]HVY15136.1 NADH-ubiquinone oxidoreductase-F iron-sulfur binding region domain-containing protein [Rhodopila sp.]